MLLWIWRKGNPLTLLVGMQTGTATLENSMEVLQKVNKRTGHLGGSVVKCLPSAQVMIPAFWDQAPHWAPRPAGSLLLPLSLPPACVPSLAASLSVK